jgi:hypothetical protein
MDAQTSITFSADASRNWRRLIYEGGVKVEVAISAQMTNLASGAAVWTNEVSEVGTVGKRDVPAVVAEMNATTGRAIEKLLTPAPAIVGMKKN